MANVNRAQIRQFRSTEGAAGLRICVLGNLTVEIDGTPVAIASRKARALLGYLVQREGVETARSSLAALLWGERSEAQARASLRQTLSELRGALAPSFQSPIIASRESVAWAPGSAWIDTRELVSAAASENEEALRASTLLLRGEFLEGLSIDEAPFEHWLAGERERFRQLASTLHSRLMDGAEKSGDIGAALSHGLKLISFDPLQEQIHRRLMRLYTAHGRRGAALAQYERCKSELSNQLGVQPEAETEALARSIKASRRGGLVKADAQAPSSPTLPDKPSIAVLPFINLTGDQEQEFFADGMTEDIIGALSRIRNLFVISRSSSYVYKNQVIRVEDAARELGVRHILEGSVRVSGSRVRVAAKLIDGQSGGHVWADRYEGDLGDIFAVQDEITQGIALAMQVKLTHGESIRLWEGQTKSLRAWEKMVLARDLFHRFTVIDNSDARRRLEEALVVDPNFTGAMALLGLTRWWDARYNMFVDKERFLVLAEREAEKIFKIDPDMAAAYMLKGAIALLRHRHDEAVGFCERAVDLAPGDSHNLAFLGLVYCFAGQSEKAVTVLKTATCLSPHVPAWCTYNLAMAHLWVGNLPEAKERAKSYLCREPDDPYGYVNLATIHDFQGRHSAASATVAELKDKFPAFGIKNVTRAEPYKEREKLDRVAEVLRRGGLPVGR